MKIKMLKTVDGASDGIHVECYEVGKIVEVTQSLRDNFVRDQQVAVDYIEEKAVSNYDNKAIEPEKNKNESDEPETVEKNKPGKRGRKKKNPLEDLGL